MLTTNHIDMFRESKNLSGRMLALCLNLSSRAVKEEMLGTIFVQPFYVTTSTRSCTAGKILTLCYCPGHWFQKGDLNYPLLPLRYRMHFKWASTNKNDIWFLCGHGTLYTWLFLCVHSFIRIIQIWSQGHSTKFPRRNGCRGLKFSSKNQNRSY